MSFAPAYLSAIANQVGGLSAFLGGFAATFLGTLLAINAPGRLATVAIGLSAVSSAAFITAVVGSTAVVAALHPEGPGFGVAKVGGTQALMTLAFMVGLYALLAALGLSGWLRSRATGLTTSTVAAVGVVLLTGMLVSVT
jgi:hypothetical protein